MDTVIVIRDSEGIGGNNQRKAGWSAKSSKIEGGLFTFFLAKTVLNYYPPLYSIPEDPVR